MKRAWNRLFPGERPVAVLGVLVTLAFFATLIGRCAQP